MDKRISIETASIDYFYDIQRLEQGFEEDRYSDTLIINALNDNNAINLVIKINNLVVGYLTASNIIDEAELLKIIVDSNFRRQGYAEQLLNELLRILRSKDTHRIFLEVRKDNIPAKRLYEKMGFIKLNERKEYYNDGVDAEIYWFNFNAKN